MDQPTSPTTTSPFPSTPLPSPPSTDRFAGLRLLSGIGEDLGVIVGLECDRHGHAKWLSFLEPGALAPRRVRLDFVRGVGADSVVLAGPREGYHITRVMTDPDDEG